jgi:hypothetical protein
MSAPQAGHRRPERRQLQHVVAVQGDVADPGGHDNLLDAVDLASTPSTQLLQQGGFT